VGNLLDAARRVVAGGGGGGGLRVMCAETLVRTSGLEDMNRLDPIQYDTVRRSLMWPATASAATSGGGVASAASAGAAGAGPACAVASGSVTSGTGAGAVTGASSSSAAAAATAAAQDESPYAFDVFLTLITGTERGGEWTAGYHTTGDLIPLLPGDPGVFQALVDKKTNASPCWLPAAFDGIEWDSKLHHKLVREYSGFETDIPAATWQSLARAGLFNPETGEMMWHWQDAASTRAWRKWHLENGTEPHGPQELHGGDIHIGMNELLLADEDSVRLQEAAAAKCTAPLRYQFAKSACACNGSDKWSNDLSDVFGRDRKSDGGDKKREKVEFLGNGPQDVGRWQGFTLVHFSAQLEPISAPNPHTYSTKSAYVELESGGV